MKNMLFLILSQQKYQKVQKKIQQISQNLFKTFFFLIFSGILLLFTIYFTFNIAAFFIFYVE